MKFTVLYTGNDNKSHFLEKDTGVETEQPLGNYSKKYPVTGMFFREFAAGAAFDLHNAPQPQYIIYLEGEVSVSTTSGETRTFKPGDILFVTDVTGEGHITKTLTRGKSIIITADEFDTLQKSTQERSSSLRARL
jgi:hypothetical protein